MKKTMVFGLVVLFLMCSLAFAVQGTIKLKVLGGAPFSKQPVPNVEAARQFVKDNIEDVRVRQGDDFFLDLAGQVDRVVFHEENVLVGDRLIWMLFRNKAKQVRYIEDVEWAGEAPFKAFGFDIAHAGQFYHMVVPQFCGNISLAYIRGPVQHFDLPKKEEALAPTKPALSIPVPTSVSASPPASAKHRDNFKIKIGYLQDQLTTSGPEFKLNEERTLRSYLPLPSYFYFCEDDDSGWLYSTERYLNQVQGDRLWLQKNRVGSISYSGRSFNLGLEFRLWKNLWVSADYFQSRKMKMDVQETMEDLEVKRLDYLGYYPISSTYVHYLKFGRRVINHQASITAINREVNLMLKWSLKAGRFSLAPAIGISGRQLSQDRKEDYYISFLYPWKDKVVSLSEVHGQDKFRRYDYTVVAGISGEIRILKPVAVGVDAWYRKFPDQSAHLKSLFDGDWKVNSNPWRVTASLKLVI